MAALKLDHRAIPLALPVSITQADPGQKFATEPKIRPQNRETRESRAGGRSRVGHTFAVVGERHGTATFWNFDCVDSENAQLNPSSGKLPEPGRPQFLTTRRNVIASRTNALAIPINSGRRKIVNSDE